MSSELLNAADAFLAAWPNIRNHPGVAEPSEVRALRAALAATPSTADPALHWRADRTGVCLCGGQCHHGDRIRPCSESCAEAMARATPAPDPALAGLREAVQRWDEAAGNPDYYHVERVAEKAAAYIAALAATPTAPPSTEEREGLDVGRLGRAIESWYLTPATIGTGAPGDSAQWIIAEYDRLGRAP